MSLQEQSAFQLGYYHETQKRYTKKGGKLNMSGNHQNRYDFVILFDVENGNP